MSNLCDNRIERTASESQLIRTGFDNRFNQTAFAILLAVSISISWSGPGLAGTTSSAQTLSSTYWHDRELIAGIPFIKSKDDEKAKEDKKADDEKKANKEKVKADAKAEAAKKDADKAAEKTARKLDKEKEKSESKTQAVSKETSKPAKKGAQNKLPRQVNEPSDTLTNKVPLEKTIEKAPIEKNSASSGTPDYISQQAQAQRYQADSALISLLNDLARALKDPKEQAKLNDADQKFVLSVAAEVLAKTVELRSDGNRIIDKKGMSGGPMTVEAWSSGDVTVTDDCRGSLAAVWAKKEDGLLDVTIAGACHNRTAPSGKKVGEYIVVLSAHSSVQKGFEIQSQSDVQFWLAKLNSIRIEADCCSNQADSAADKTSADTESETKELRRNSTVVLQSLVTEREHEFNQRTTDRSNFKFDQPRSDRSNSISDQTTSDRSDSEPKSNRPTSDRSDSKPAEITGSGTPNKEADKPRTEVNSKNTDKKEGSKAEEKKREQEEKLAEAEKERKAADQERQAKIAEKEKEKQDEVRADAEAEKQDKQDKLAAKAEKERDAEEKERDKQEKQLSAEAKKQVKYQAKQAELDRKRISAESKTNNSDRNMPKSLQEDSASRLAQNANKNSHLSREDMILAEATRQAEIEAQGGVVATDSFNSESSSRADMVLAEATRQAEQERREAADMRVPYNAQTNPPLVDIDDQQTALRPTPIASEQTSNQSSSGSQSVPLKDSSNNLSGTEPPLSDPAKTVNVTPTAPSNRVSSITLASSDGVSPTPPASPHGVSPPTASLDGVSPPASQDGVSPTPSASSDEISVAASGFAPTVSLALPSSSMSTHDTGANPPSTVTTAHSNGTPSLAGTRMVLPARSIAGQYITAAVIDQKNGGLGGVELRFNGLSLLTDDRGQVTYKVPDDTTPGESLNVAMPGNPRIRAFPIEVSQPLTTSSEQGAPTVERASRMVAANGTIVIGGHNFDGMAGHNVITIDSSRQCKVLAASPVELVVAVPKTIAPGLHHATVGMGSLKSAAFGFEFVIPQVVSAPNSPRSAQLNRIFVKVLGTPNKVQVHLTNQTPDVIKISPGNDVHVTSSGGKENRASVNFQRLRKGSYRVGAVID